MKNSIFIVLSTAVLLYIVNAVRNKKIPINESFWWVFLSIVMLLLSIFPYSIDYFASLLNISYSPSLLFIICIIFLVFICFRNGKRISELQLKIVDLSQELAVLDRKSVV